MEPVRYHRQLSRSIYIWGVFTPSDFSVLIAALAVNIVILDSNAGMAAILVGYPAYLAALRLGRPPGYDAHLAQALMAPRLLRPAREERSRHPAP